MPTKTLSYRNKPSLERDFPRELVGSIGNGAFVQEFHASFQHVTVPVGLTWPETVGDPATGESILSFLNLRDVHTFTFEKGAHWTCSPIDRRTFFEQARQRRADLVARAEQAMIATAYPQLARVEPIGSGLTPIREILIYINEEGSLPTKLIRRGKQRRYIPMLKGLGYVTPHKDSLRAGPELQKIEHAYKAIQRSPEFYEKLMGDVLRVGYRELTEGFGVKHLVPIVRTANAYYWPSQQWDRPLEYRAKDFANQLRRLHPRYRVSPLKLQSHLVDMARAQILEKNGRTYTAQRDVWVKYRKELPRILGR